jgi:serine-type D-Ala-D-Ala carboxypeptidase/endopeptidase (penicillin-binding protein 4)
MKPYRPSLLTIPCFFFLCLIYIFGAEEASCARLEEMIGPSDAVVLIDPHGRVVVRRNAERPLIPASTIKVLTALAALHYLGPDYRFETAFYMAGAQNLKIKGFGDPLLISELLPDIAKQIRACIDRFNDLLVDTSYFDKGIRVPGVSRSNQPYDAPVGPLSVNFNTVSFHRQKEKYIGGDPYAPLVPTALAHVRKSGLKRGRIPLPPDNNAPALYAGELFRHHFLKAGIASKGKVAAGTANPAHDRLIYRFTSDYTLREIVARLLAFSNNFMANQLFLSFGAAALGPPATIEKGAAAASGYAREVLNLQDFSMIEGSGISRENRIPPDELLKVLSAFEPHRALMRRDGEEYYKTGTLAGIATRAGFFEDETEGLYRFAVMMNTPGKSIKPVLEYLRRLAQ